MFPIRNFNLFKYNVFLNMNLKNINTVLLYKPKLMSNISLV